MLRMDVRASSGLDTRRTLQLPGIEAEVVVGAWLWLSLMIAMSTVVPMCLG